jgi:hypothetical protein
MMNSHAKDYTAINCERLGGKPERFRVTFVDAPLRAFKDAKSFSENSAQRSQPATVIVTSIDGKLVVGEYIPPEINPMGIEPDEFKAAAIEFVENELKMHA